MRKLSTIVFKNVLGISEATLQPKDVNIISGAKGTGKTSFLDGIEVLISNKCSRKQIVKNGETEAILYGEIGNIIIDRKLRTKKSDAIKVTEDGNPVTSPQTFLNSLTDGLQFNPIKFYEADEKEQNKILLGLLDITWTMDDIYEWFGERPAGIDYEQHILSVLDQIQSNKGQYYLKREDLNRSRKSKEAVIADIRKGIPQDFDIKVKDIKLSEKYDEISKLEQRNNNIKKAQELAAGHANVIAGIQSASDAEKSALDLKYANKRQEFNDTKTLKENRIKDLENQIKLINGEIEQIIMNRADLVHQQEAESKNIDALTAEKIETANAKLGEYKAYIDKHTPTDVEPMKVAAEKVEHLQSFVREFERIAVIQDDIEKLAEESAVLSDKIDKARYLPGELLKTAVLPIDGVTVEAGAVLIHGLPIGNLSDGEKLELSIKIAEHKAGDVGIVLIDGFEKLNPSEQTSFIEQCKQTGLQYFITNVKDGELEISTY